MTQNRIVPAYIGFTCSTDIENLNSECEPGIILASNELLNGKYIYTIDTFAYKPLNEFGVDNNNKLKALLESKGFKDIEIIKLNDYEGFTNLGF